MKIKLLKALSIGVVVAGVISAIATINGNLGVAEIKCECDDNCEENGFSYYCKSLTYKSDNFLDKKVVIDIKNQKIGDKILYLKKDSKLICPDYYRVFS